MARVPELVLAIALWGALVAHGAAQDDEVDPLVQLQDELVENGQGVLLPLDGALDPPEAAALPELPTPPLESTVTDATVASDAVVEDATEGEETEPVAAAEPAEEVVAEEPAVEEVVAEEITQPVAEDVPAMEVTEEAGSLPQLDAIADIATAELGNPESIGPWRLWLATYRTIREAQTVWQQLAKDNRDILGDLLPVVVLKELGGESDTFFRLQAGPLPDEATAKARCEALGTRNLYCTVLGPQDG